MRTPIRTLKELVAYHRILRSADSSGYRVELVNESTYLADAKALHAQVYLARNFISPTELNEAGHLSEAADPYQRYADYFAVSREVGGQTLVVAIARQIRAQSKTGHHDFPTLAHMDLFDDRRAEIEAADASRCVEISALAKKAGESSVAALLLYRAMWQHSLRAGHHRWIMACDEAVFRRLRFLFGDALVVIGPRGFYMGSHVVPVALELKRSLARATARRPVGQLLRRDLTGFFTAGLSPQLVEATLDAARATTAPRRST